MGKPWEFFEEMNEIVYVADVETYELVYMNRRARQQYGVEQASDYKGKLCYEILQQGTSPCYFCNNAALREHQFEEWTYENHILKQKFLLKDTLVVEDGRKYRLEIAIDITGKSVDNATVDDYVNHEEMINEALRISLLQTNPDESIKSLLAYIGKTLKCERIYIFEEEQGLFFRNTYEWCAPGVVPQIDNLQNVTMETTEIWMEAFRKNQNIIIKDLEETKDTDPLMYECLKPQDINSIVVSPLIYNNKIIGFYGVDNPPGKYMENISTMFMILGHFIVAQIRRGYLFRRMQRMSFHDQLTGLGNRHAFNNFLENIDRNRSVGIVYCDIMGLKAVNDKYGHKAGDKLILNACGCLRRVFGNYEMFRMGGDEFLVLCSGIESEELSKLSEKLKIEMKGRNALMAVGLEWRPNSAGDIEKLLVLADEKMYEDKRQYYNGVRERRKPFESEKE
jgi:diguanylate cyclase (GGDEF)-like protein